MRAISFRAWHKQEQKMYQNVMIFHDMAYDYSCTSAPGFGIDSESISPIATTSGQIEIMQYTGLKDSHGRDVYEGDIIEVTKSYNAKHLQRHQVVYREDIGGYLPFIQRFVYGDFAFSDIADTFGVIGNIYEHPDLLKQPESEG